jgi:hypothetical protein
MVNAMIKLAGSAIWSYISDLLPFPRWATSSETVMFVGRLLGCCTIGVIAVLGIRHAGAISATQVLLLGLLVVTVALPVGNLIKEVATLIGGVAINWLGLEFRRTRLTLTGAVMSEVYRRDGTWDRYVLATAETVHEWSDLSGECYREVSIPRWDPPGLPQCRGGRNDAGYGVATSPAHQVASYSRQT